MIVATPSGKRKTVVCVDKRESERYRERARQKERGGQRGPDRDTDREGERRKGGTERERGRTQTLF